MKHVPQKPFAATFQAILIGLMILSFIMIAQQFSKVVYQSGFILLVGSTLIQIVAGNIPSTARFEHSMKLLAIGLSIIVSVFLVGIFVAPHLANIGRR